jgi:hypothetical protein
MTQKTLDAKLARIHADPHGARDFILADAKDADMAMGLLATGSAWDGGRDRPRSLAEYREQMREIARQELVDILLMSASSHDLLGVEERLFDHSPVTVAVRANDTTDIHLARGGCYPRAHSAPFRSATIEQLQCGRVACSDEERQRGCSLGLYSVTLNNHPEADLRTLEAYRDFRIEAEQKGFRHFLEVFDPNVPRAMQPERVGDFVNDQIVRLLAGVPRSGRPLFLKIAYPGGGGRNDARCFSSLVRSPEIRREGGSFWTKDQLRRASAHFHSISSQGSGWGDRTEGGCFGLPWRTPEAQDSPATSARTGFGLNAKILAARTLDVDDG